MLKNFVVLLKELVKKIEKDVKLRFKAFTPEKLDAVNQQIDMLSSEMARFAKVKEQNNKQVDEFFPSAENANRSEQFAKIAQSIAVTKNRQWYEKSCNTLTNNDNFWDECYARLLLAGYHQTATDFNKQRNVWKQQGRYAVFSTPDLIAVYWRNINNIEAWLIQAKSELHHQRKKLSRKQTYQYQTYIQKLEDELQNEKRVMRASLLTRISLARKEGDLRFDDLVFATAKTLEKVKAIPVIELSKGIRRHITPSILSYIQQIIGIDGTEDEKNKLNKLLYGSPISQTKNDINSSLNLRINHLGISFAIPGSVKDIVPDKPPFYTKLPKIFHIIFRGEKSRYEFFQNENCQYLLIAQNYFPRKELDVDINDTTLNYSSTWGYYRDLSQMLMSEQKRRIKKSNTLSPIIYPTAHRLLDLYQERLSGIANQLFSKQLKLFDRFLCILEKQLRNRDLSAGELKYINDVENKISIFKKSSGIQTSMQWNNISARYKAIIASGKKRRITDAVAARATQAMKKAKIGKKLNAMEKEIVVEVSAQIASGLPVDSYEKTTCVMNHRIMVNKLGELLTSELSKQGLTMTSAMLVEHLQVLKQHFESISALNPDLAKSSETQIALYRYFYILLKNIEDLSGRSAFTTLEGHLQFILKTLLQLPIDDVLRKEVSLLSDSIEKYKSFDWGLFKLVAIEPSLNAIYKVLTLNNALDDKSSEVINHGSNEESTKKDNSNSTIKCSLI